MPSATVSASAPATKANAVSLTSPRVAPRGMRLCSEPTCTKAARRRGMRCDACQKRAWRKEHRDADRAREKKRTFSDEQRLLRNARATVAMAIKRGSLLPQPCQVQDCTSITKAVPHHPDPRRKLDIIWLCPTHRQDQRASEAKARRIAAQTQAKTARLADWEILRARFACEWDSLAPDVQATIIAQAQATPLGRLAPPGSPLGKQNLIHAFGIWRESHA